jgi:hypothetical protein
MQALVDPNNDVSAFAVDTLASAVIYNTLGTRAVRPSGTISDPIIYGFVFDSVVANRPVTLTGSIVNMTLVACMDTLIRSGPLHYSRLIYFRGLDTYLQFAVNEDLRDEEEQVTVAHNAMVTAAYALPITAVGVLLVAFGLDFYWRHHGSSQFAGLKSRFSGSHL